MENTDRIIALKNQYNQLRGTGLSEEKILMELKDAESFFLTGDCEGNNQFWLITYSCADIGNTTPMHIAIRNTHPFQWIRNQYHRPEKYVLLNFFPMTAEQFNEWYGF